MIIILYYIRVNAMNLAEDLANSELSAHQLTKVFYS